MLSKACLIGMLILILSLTALGVNKVLLWRPYEFDIVFDTMDGEPLLHVVNNTNTPLQVTYIVAVGEDGVQDLKQGPRVTSGALYYPLGDLGVTEESMVYVCFTYGTASIHNAI